MTRFEWTPEADSLLRQHHAQGHNYPAIADAIGCTIPDVSRRTKRLGLTPNHAPPAAANQAVRDQLAARREQLANAALADCENIRERIWDTYNVVVNGPEGPTVETLDLPDAKAVSDFANAIAKLQTVSENLDRMGKARSADIQKSNINILFDNLAKVLEDDK